MASTTPRDVSWRELVAGLLVLAIGIALLPAAGGRILWTYPLWLDELCCTIYPTQEATSPFGVIENLAKRQDFAPPTLHLIVWTVGKAAGDMTPALLRWISLISMSLALVFVYAALRRRFAVGPSAAGALAIATHPIVIDHAFQGRFYAPWLLFVAAYAWAVGRGDRAGGVLQGVFAVCVATIHWFGIISLVIMASAVALSFAPRWRKGLRAIAPSAAGFIAFLTCLPLMAMQRVGASAFSWIEPMNSGQVLGLAKLFFWKAVPVCAAILIVAEVARQFRRGAPAVFPRIVEALRQPSVVALASLAAFPVAIMLVSVLVQPSMYDRYLIATVLVWGPLVALALEPLWRFAQAVAMALLLLQLKPGVMNIIGVRQSFANSVAAEARAYEQAAQLKVPVVFPWLHSLYPVVGPHRRLPARARMLDVPDSVLARLYPGDRMGWFRRRIRVDILSARSHTRVYGFPEVATTAELDTVKRFVVMSSDLRMRGGTEQAKVWAGIVFPHHNVDRLDDYTSIFERK